MFILLAKTQLQIQAIKTQFCKEKKLAAAEATVYSLYSSGRPECSAKKW
jgi:hypothetical protein